jgi:hypothetical protein
MDRRFKVLAVFDLIGVETHNSVFQVEVFPTHPYDVPTSETTSQAYEHCCVKVRRWCESLGPLSGVPAFATPLYLDFMGFAASEKEPTRLLGFKGLTSLLRFFDVATPRFRRFEAFNGIQLAVSVRSAPGEKRPEIVMVFGQGPTFASAPDLEEEFLDVTKTNLIHVLLAKFLKRLGVGAHSDFALLIHEAKKVAKVERGRAAPSPLLQGKPASEGFVQRLTCNGFPRLGFAFAVQLILPEVHDFLLRFSLGLGAQTDPGGFVCPAILLSAVPGAETPLEEGGIEDER